MQNAPTLHGDNLLWERKKNVNLKLRLRWKMKEKSLWILSRNQLVGLFVCCKIKNNFFGRWNAKQKHKYLGTFYMWIIKLKLKKT